ncbi:MAG: polyphosphate polymerase domain-containing protein [bacterium]|nr:polyphosphate polymerase domain-containing protein [bacterium]
MKGRIGIAPGLEPDPSEKVSCTENYHRYELKYYLPKTDKETIRNLIAPWVVHDRHSEIMSDKCYTVRSIYFDTDDLLYYFEKMDSVNVRKKLRVRTYNLSENKAPAFLEIKRKVGRRGFKERVMLPLELVDPALNGKHSSEVLGDRPFVDRKVLDRFKFNMKVKYLQPVVLVTYEREAFIGIENDRIRVTFDQNIRSLANPNLNQVFEEQELRQFEDENFVLEMKFDNRMPRWMAQVIRMLNLRSESYSKYCHAIDAWTPHPQ